MIKMPKYALVICRNHLNQFLCVQERTSKWWIVGGSVEPKETFREAALRETREEAGIDITLKGILAIDTVNFTSHALRVIFYAESNHLSQKPKQVPDK